MSLPTSGTISLNDIHIVAGGTSGTTCTINDSDIRGLIGSTLGTQVSFSDFYGVSAYDVRFNASSFSSSHIVPNGDIASVLFQVSGKGTTSITGDFSRSGVWISPTPPPAEPQYEVMAVKTFGITPIGSALNKRIPIIDNPYWSISSFREGLTVSCGLVIYLYEQGSSTLISSADIDMSATVQSGGGDDGIKFK
jgi:hypothetical protein